MEEARQADLLLHVADASHPGVKDQITAVYTVLEELEIEAKDTLLVLNKVDALADLAPLRGLMSRYPNAIPISARRGQGLEELTRAVSESLSRGFLDLHLETNHDNGRLLAFLASQGEILSKQFTESFVRIHCRLPRHRLGLLHQQGTEIRFLNADASPGHAPAGYINGFASINGTAHVPRCESV